MNTWMNEYMNEYMNEHIDKYVNKQTDTDTKTDVFTTDREKQLEKRFLFTETTWVFDGAWTHDWKASTDYESSAVLTVHAAYIDERLEG